MYQLLYISWNYKQSLSNHHNIAQKNKKEKNKNNISNHDINTPTILVNKELINIIDKSIEMTEKQIISLITCSDIY
jgi:hypothetical protein